MHGGTPLDLVRDARHTIRHYFLLNNATDQHTHLWIAVEGCHAVVMVVPEYLTPVRVASVYQFYPLGADSDHHTFSLTNTFEIVGAEVWQLVHHPHEQGSCILC